jgi:hypothetical protein
MFAACAQCISDNMIEPKTQNQLTMQDTMNGASDAFCASKGGANLQSEWYELGIALTLRWESPIAFMNITVVDAPPVFPQGASAILQRAVDQAANKLPERNVQTATGGKPIIDVLLDPVLNGRSVEVREDVLSPQLQTCYSRSSKDSRSIEKC